MIDTKSIRNKVLHLALTGRLVEQRPEEGTAEELYCQIQEEKKRLVKEGKTKKEKPLPEITEEEKPFEIPETWKWVRLGEISVLNPKNELDYTAKVAFVPMSYISGGYLSQYRYDVKNWGDIKKDHSHFATGDIGIAKITPCFQNRKSVIFEDLPGGYGAGSTELSIVRIINKDKILQKYLLWLFKTEYFIVNGIKSFTGTAGQQRIGKNYLSSCLIPLPPLEEQKRIVAKLEEIFSPLDAIDSLQTQCGSNANILKDKLLAAALGGRLVEQRQEEGSAEELYCQIQEEKERLVKEGKIKKEKPLPEITEEEEPFEIPETWKWVRLSSVGITKTGNTPSKLHTDYFGSFIPFIGPGDIQNNVIRYDHQGLSESGANFGRTVEAGTVLQVCIGGSIGKCAISKMRVSFNQQINAITPLVVSEKYLFYILNSQYFLTSIKMHSGGTATPIINRGAWDAIPIPLPPLEEQKRIVNKLDELFALCRQLKGRR